MEWIRTTATLLLSLLPLSLAATPINTPEPEAPTGLTEQQAVHGKSWIIATANPYASEAGAYMLQQGGNAIDAMVAAQLVLGLTEPQSSGLGGGAFLMYWDASRYHLTSYDGRETAPFAVTPKLFLDENGKPMRFFDAVVGGRSVGTPGTVKLLWQTHQRHGALPWKTLFRPAIALAEKGFTVSPRLAMLVEQDQDKLKRDSETARYFFKPDGSPIKAGERLRNPAYAATLKLIAKQGASAFYVGEIARDIVAKVNDDPNNPGVLGIMDLATYQIKERPPVCAPYRQYQVCGMGPPSSGALTLGQILGILNHYPLDAMGADNPDSWRLIGDASRLAFADRGRYMADSDYVPMPTRGLLAPDYLSQRAALLKQPKALETAQAGMPPWDHAMRYQSDESIELPSTSHISIVDSQRNVVSMTTTIENGFGSRLMVRGFLLNNELTDFSFRTHKDGVPIANRIEPGKRPRSSMAPTIVMQDNKPMLAVGSPGGSQIIGYVAKTLIAHLDWQKGLQQAINMPNMNNRFGTFELEQDTDAERWVAPLQQAGFEVKVKPLNSGVQAIRINQDGLVGAADPRREGRVIAH